MAEISAKQGGTRKMYEFAAIVRMYYLYARSSKDETISRQPVKQTRENRGKMNSYRMKKRIP
jgi:hypothetical protein